MNDPSSEKPKIIVDEDWKTRVQREKQQADQPGQGPQTEQDESPAGEQPPLELPPASISFLITSLATQALAALGQLPDPTDGKAVVNLNLAAHHIDMLGVLEEKTTGNLTQDEAQMLQDVLHQMRMLFVAVRDQ